MFMSTNVINGSFKTPFLGIETQICISFNNLCAIKLKRKKNLHSPPFLFSINTPNRLVTQNTNWQKTIRTTSTFGWLVNHFYRGRQWCECHSRSSWRTRSGCTMLMALNLEITCISNFSIRKCFIFQSRSFLSVRQSTLSSSGTTKQHVKQEHTSYM